MCVGEGSRIWALWCDRRRKNMFLGDYLSPSFQHEKPFGKMGSLFMCMRLQGRTNTGDGIADTIQPMVFSCI